MMSLFAATLDLATLLGTGLDPLARKAVSRHLVDLIALVLGAKGDTAELARGRGLATAHLWSSRDTWRISFLSRIFP
jgi:hypothetical protein